MLPNLHFFVNLQAFPKCSLHMGKFAEICQALAPAALICSL